jgi:hypothetical protein
LHPHKRVHLHPKSFLNAERHIAREISLAIQQAGQRRPRNPKGYGGGRYRQASRLDNLRSNESPGWGGFFNGIGCSLGRSSKQSSDSPSSFATVSNREMWGTPR